MTLQLYSSVLYTEIKHLIIIAHFEPMPKSCLHHAAAAGYPGPGPGGKIFFRGAFLFNSYIFRRDLIACTS